MGTAPDHSDAPTKSEAHMLRMLSVGQALSDYCQGRTTRDVAGASLERAGLAAKAITQLLDTADANLTGVK